MRTYLSRMNLYNYLKHKQNICWIYVNNNFYINIYINIFRNFVKLNNQLVMICTIFIQTKKLEQIRNIKQKHFKILFCDQK